MPSYTIIPACAYCNAPIPYGRYPFPCIACDGVVYCNTTCQLQDMNEHMSVCRQNRPSLGSRISDIDDLRAVINSYIPPRQPFLTPTALRAILRPPPGTEKQSLDTHFFLLEFIPTSTSIMLLSASVQPMSTLYSHQPNGYEQYAALMRYSQSFRRQYEAAGADVAGTLLIQCRCQSVLGQANDVIPVTVVRWLLDQTKSQPTLEPDWERTLIARMNVQG